MHVLNLKAGTVETSVVAHEQVRLFARRCFVRRWMWLGFVIAVDE
jgi:hypothetical protein